MWFCNICGARIPSKCTCAKPVSQDIKCFINRYPSGTFTIKMFPHNRKVCHSLADVYILLLQWNVKPEQIVENTVS